MSVNARQNGEIFRNTFGVIEKHRSQGTTRRIPTLLDKLDRVYTCHHFGALEVDPKYTHARIVHPCVPQYGVWEFQIGMNMFTIDGDYAGQEIDIVVPVNCDRIYMTQSGMTPPDAPVPTIQLLIIEDEEV